MYPQFHDPMLSMSLGPAIRPEPPKPEPHLVHDWRPIEGQPDHVKCIGCGAVALREYVMPPAAFGVDLAAGVDKTVVLHMKLDPVCQLNVQTTPRASLRELQDLLSVTEDPLIRAAAHKCMVDLIAMLPPPPWVVFADSALEQIRREDAFAREHRTWFHVYEPVEDDDL